MKYYTTRKTILALLLALSFVAFTQILGGNMPHMDINYNDTNNDDMSYHHSLDT